MKLAIAKKACKCNLCGKQINVGDKAQWIEVQKHHHGEWSGKAYSRTMWELRCVEGCGERLYAQEQAKKAEKQQQDAQFAVDTLRNLNTDKATIDGMIALFASNGIVVN